MRARLHRRLARLEQAASLATPPTIVPPPPPAAEASVLASELVTAFSNLVAEYRQRYGLSETEAVARARECELHPGEEHSWRGPPEQATWEGLHLLSWSDPALALKRWEEVKQAARNELASGHRGARGVEGFRSDCWERAQFLALYDELMAACPPRNGLERELVEQMAQAQTLLLSWQRVLVSQTMLSAMHCQKLVQEPERYKPPRVSDAKAVEQAAAMVERCQRLYLRSLKALQELQRATPTVVVRHARQVNIGQQQVNVAGG